MNRIDKKNKEKKSVAGNHCSVAYTPKQIGKERHDLTGNMTAGERKRSRSPEI